MIRVDIVVTDNITAYDLYDVISWYPQDTWKDSPEFLELRRRLQSMPYEELREKGYHVPNKLYNAHRVKVKR